MDDRRDYIRDRSQRLFEMVAIDGDDLDLHLIETVLDEVFQAGVEEAEQQKRTE